MVSMLDVVALYADGWESDSEKDAVETNLVQNVPKTTGLVLDYHNINDLVQQVSNLLVIDPDHPCLSSIEIIAHGNPSVINDLAVADATSWGGKLKALKWCDAGSIYLAGCNTGLQLDKRYPAQRRGPIAKMLADAMAYDPSSFPVHITVYGSSGYLSGCHTLSDEKTIKTFSETEWHAGLQFPPFWRETTEWPPFEGATDAQGGQCWIGFKNGTW
jgi:hypothetical protein